MSKSSLQLDPSIEEASKADLLRQVTGRALRFALPALGIMYAAVAFFHHLRFEPPSSWYLFSLAGTSFFLLLGTHLLLKWRESPVLWMNRVAFGALLLVLINTLCVLILSRDIHYSANILLLFMGSGFLLYSLQALVAFHLLTLGAWFLVLEWMAFSDDASYLVVPTGIALLISYVARQIMVGNVLELERARRIDAARTRDLEKALAALKAEQKRRKELAEEANFAHEILSTVSNLVLVGDRDGNIVYASSSVERILGFELSEILVDGWFRLTRPNLEKAREEQANVAEKARSGPKKGTYEKQVRDASGTSHWILWQDTPLEEGLLIGVGTDITDKKRIEEERDRLIEELQETLEEVRTLEGLLPICAHCKKVREDTGYWKTVETFIQERSSAVFSHGICPDCMKQLYGPEADS